VMPSVMRMGVTVSDSTQLDLAAEGDSIREWTSATTLIRRRNDRTSTGTAWQSGTSKTCSDGPWKIGRDKTDRGSPWGGPKRGGISASLRA